MNAKDDPLIQKAKAGDRAAFQQLLERYYDMIFRTAYKILGRREDAADVAQEVCLRLADKLAGFRGESSFTTWLYRITLNACRDLEKKQRGHGIMDQRFVEFERNADADQRDNEQRRATLYRAIAELEPPLPETMMLVVSEGLSHAEAGKVLNCAESTISWRLHEARKLLKMKFSTAGGSDA